MEWNVFDANRRPLQPEVVAQITRPSSSEFQNRFAVLQPGESLSREFEITYLLREHREGYATTHTVEAHTTPPSFSSKLRGFASHACNRKLTWMFRRRPCSEDSPGFVAWFQHSQRGLPISLTDEITSNEVAITFR